MGLISEAATIAQLSVVLVAQVLIIVGEAERLDCLPASQITTRRKALAWWWNIDSWCERTTFFCASATTLIKPTPSLQGILHFWHVPAINSTFTIVRPDAFPFDFSSSGFLLPGYDCTCLVCIVVMSSCGHFCPTGSHFSHAPSTTHLSHHQSFGLRHETHDFCQPLLEPLDFLGAPIRRWLE